MFTSVTALRSSIGNFDMYNNNNNGLITKRTMQLTTYVSMYHVYQPTLLTTKHITLHFQ